MSQASLNMGMYKDTHMEKDLEKHRQYFTFWRIKQNVCVNKYIYIHILPALHLPIQGEGESCMLLSSLIPYGEQFIHFSKYFLFKTNMPYTSTRLLK